MKEQDNTERAFSHRVFVNAVLKSCSMLLRASRNLTGKTATRYLVSRKNLLQSKLFSE